LRYLNSFRSERDDQGDHTATGPVDARKAAVRPDPREDTPRQAWGRALAMTAQIGRDGFLTLPVLIDQLADRFGEAPALLSESERLSYRDLAARTNRFARWALAQGLEAGDVVCLLMSNCADYVPIWLGLTRIGATVALVNTNLAGASLAHCVNLVAPKAVLVGDDLAAALAAARPRLAPQLRCWVHGKSTLSAGIEREIGRLSGDRLAIGEAAPPSIGQRALLLYTSGTTGLPKAANVSHFRLIQWCCWAAGMMDTRATDRLYDPLPMYHSIGGIVAIGAMLVNGGSVVLRRRFSVSRFWDDVVEWDCTLFQYVGELCRYLVNSPPHRRETAHRIRLCSGNGLREKVWIELQRRFGIPRVLEYYAATEGNFSLYNCEGKPGAVGRIPPYLAHRFAVALIRLDRGTGEPLRDRNGLCIRAAADEVGEAIGRIGDDGAGPGGRFEGYTDRAASQQKVLRDVLEVGDAWLRTGDLMRRDKNGYFYFVDRIGDTFRWKGENVSTTEVAEAIAEYRDVREAVVYGVAVPETEGRAGMAAIVVTPEFELDDFRSYLVAALPEYARPLFLRICPALATTATLKPAKQGLAGEAYDPAATSDPIYFDDRGGRAFVRLDAALYRRLSRGALRL
jgi:fatty-acyl-CoA synthase